MIYRKLHIILLMIGACINSSAQYISQYEAPNPLLFMGGFPEYQETRFSVDVKHYFDGKDIQNNNPTRAALIRSDATYGTEGLIGVFSPCINYTISSTTTPRLYILIANTSQTSGYAADKKTKYGRMRPCVRFNEQPYSPIESLSSLRNSKSYPSAHTATGWGVGLTLAALVPIAQDTILARAYDYGQSRVWGGMHWQSDVDDARVISSACFARMIPTDLFNNHFYNARTEVFKIYTDSLGIDIPDFEAEDYFSVEKLPNPIRYLPIPPKQDEYSPENAYDISRYLWGKHQREGENGLKAKFDTNSDVDVLINNFARAIKMNITPESTPYIYEVLQRGAEIALDGCKKAQDHYKRVRPYDYFKEDAFAFENQEELSKIGSYPSTNAARAWVTALLMTAINPEQQDTILKIGFDMGESNVIAGINWQSDVDAGRLVGCATLSRMVSNPDMYQKILLACKEYEDMTQQIITEEEDLQIGTNDNEDSSTMFTIDGKVATKDSRGILVGKNKKILR